jgi:8-oxo-dGTP pyrophosphatase MutT (NUDIX family)
VPAASVILLLEAAGGFEVFMARRHIKSDFAPDVYVFPGGKADEGDAVEGDHVTLPATAKSLWQAPAVGRVAIHMAAIRELFEESGLLLARRLDGSPLEARDDPAVAARFAVYRDRVRSGTLSMRDLAKQEELVFSGDQLHLFAHWITPEILTKRFDTYFFLARLPAGARARHADLVELTDSLWIRPADALARFAGGEFPLVFATERILMRLAAAPSIDDLWRTGEAEAAEPITPRWIMRSSERIFLIPGDEGYEEALTQ